MGGRLIRVPLNSSWLNCNTVSISRVGFTEGLFRFLHFHKCTKCKWGGVKRIKEPRRLYQYVTNDNHFTENEHFSKCI